MRFMRVSFVVEGTGPGSRGRSFQARSVSAPIRGRQGRGVRASAAAFAGARACARRQRLAQALVGAVVVRADTPLRALLRARGLADAGSRCRRAWVLLRVSWS